LSKKPSGSKGTAIGRTALEGRPYLVHEEAAELLRVSPRTLAELVARRAIPHRRISGSRRILYVPSELQAFVDGCDLEVLELAGSGRVVRPRQGSAKRAA
jgi:excisionase family DNA binding protein